MLRSLWSLDVLAVVLCVASVVLVTVGVSLWSVPAGLVVLGVQLLAAGYVIRFMEAQNADS